MAEGSSKILWKRAQLAVNRFTKTAETDVARLQQFKKNILEVNIIKSCRYVSVYYMSSQHSCSASGVA